MHKNTFIFLFIFIVAFSSSVYAQKGESPKRELVWAEEFDYTGQPNPEIWTPEVGRIRNHEAQYYTNRYRDFMGKLNVLPPSIEPQASGHIIEQIELVKTILTNGFAYEANGSVYFDVIEYNKKYAYGK